MDIESNLRKGSFQPVISLWAFFKNEYGNEFYALENVGLHMVMF